ncbi:MAG TPA: methyltransferase domain-containing protein [Streptosporangiaceae bacterium]|nr:methyltransferase domain-containing protein [Streptosporangiaceae bacterium]
MSEVHEVAARGFESQASAYDRARPSYPPDAVDWVVESLGIRPGRRIVDLAAGTGKLTALIAPAGSDLVAVEPVAAMRGRLRERLPDLPVLAGVAESLPFTAGSIDAVVVAQAFHWFDAQRAMAEIGRAVRSGGRLGLIWNARDRSVDWVNRVWSVMDAVEKHAPWRDHRDGTGAADSAWRRSEQHLTAADTQTWSQWTEATFFHVHYSSHEDVVDRMRSVSHIAVLPQPSQQAVLAEIRTILREHPQTRNSEVVGIPYRVDAMYTERR